MKPCCAVTVGHCYISDPSH